MGIRRGGIRPNKRYVVAFGFPNVGCSDIAFSVLRVGDEQFAV